MTDRAERFNSLDWGAVPVTLACGCRSAGSGAIDWEAGDHWPLPCEACGEPTTIAVVHWDQECSERDWSRAPVGGSR